MNNKKNIVRLVVGIFVAVAIIAGILIKKDHDKFMAEYYVPEEVQVWYAPFSRTYREVDHGVIIYDGFDEILSLDNPYLTESSKEKLAAFYEYRDTYTLAADAVFTIAPNSYWNRKIEITDINYGECNAKGMDFTVARYVRNDSFLEESYFYPNVFYSFVDDEGMDPGYVFEIEVMNRIAVLWANGEIDDFYSVADFRDVVWYYQSSGFAEIDNDPDYDWFRKVCQFSYSDSAASDVRSTDNYYIFNLFLENYLNYNQGFVPTLHARFDRYGTYDSGSVCEIVVTCDVYSVYYMFFEVYKEYGDAIWGEYIDGEYVIDNYDEMFGEIDEVFMNVENLTVEELRGVES